MRRANDPQRREKIVQATLDAVIAHGIHAVTHRKIATIAQVPLGSMTYYFSGIDELLMDAFIEGMTLHFVTDKKPLRREDILLMVERIAGLPATVSCA